MLSFWGSCQLIGGVGVGLRFMGGDHCDGRFRHTGRGKRGNEREGQIQEVGPMAGFELTSPAGPSRIRAVFGAIL